MTKRLYHLDFDPADLPPGIDLVLLSGDPQRSAMIANGFLSNPIQVSDNRGLDVWRGLLPNGKPVLCATSGMGAPSTTIVVNELVQAGITTFIRIGTSGSIAEHVRVGDVVITKAALTMHGAALDIAPAEYPAVADPFMTVALAESAKALGVRYHVGIGASTDTFFEGQERTDSSANPVLLRRLRGRISEYESLNILNFEMEAGTLLKMAGVYGFTVGCVVAIVAQRHDSEDVDLQSKDKAITDCISVAIRTAELWK